MNSDTLEKIENHTSEATGIPLRSVYNSVLNSVQSTLRKKRGRLSLLTDLLDYQIKSICDIIYNFHKTEESRFAINKLLLKI